MAFKIIQKLKPDAVKSKSIEMSLLPKYYKAFQQSLLKKTTVEAQTDFFFCIGYQDGQDLFIAGDLTPAYKKLVLEAAKSKHGFDKTNVCGGKTFILREEGKAVLCILANASMGKAKKLVVEKALNKLRKAYMKQIAAVRWLDAPLVASSDDSGVESTESTETGGGQEAPQDTPETPPTSGGSQTRSTDKESGTEAPRTVDRDDIVKRAQDLQRGIRKIKDDVIPRYKKQETTPRDAEFVNAMRKAGELFRTKLTQADKETKEEFKSNKEFLDKALPQWKDLEERLHNSKNRKEMRDSLKAKLETTVETMNEIRQQIKTLLEQVDFKNLA